LHLFFQGLDLSSPEKRLHKPDIEIGKLPGTAGGSATSAGNASQNGRFMLFQMFQYAFVVTVVIDLPVVMNRISEIFQIATD